MAQARARRKGRRRDLRGSGGDASRPNPDGCARYMIVKAVGRPHVPADLFPNHHSRAEQIIAQKKGSAT